MNRMSNSRAMWLGIGVVVGLCISYFWPHEPLGAATTDRNEKFAMTTVFVSQDLEAVFVLDFLTGRLTGAVLNRNGNQFVGFYQRNVAGDLNVTEGTPNYALLGGRAVLQGAANVQWADSVLYVSEMSSGKVICYGVPYRITQTPSPPVDLIPITNFRFRGRL